MLVRFPSTVITFLPSARSLTWLCCQRLYTQAVQFSDNAFKIWRWLNINARYCYYLPLYVAWWLGRAGAVERGQRQ